MIFCTLFLLVSCTSTIAYPVVHISHPDGHLLLSWDDARQTCVDRGLTLATHAQLIAAQTQGMDQCACGWLSDGRVQYPVTWSRTGCGSRVGIVTCSPRQSWGLPYTWDVYCSTQRVSVVHIEHPDGMYMYPTMAEASLACAERGMPLATSVQLRAANNQGYDVCRCGWLSDGSVQSSITKARTGCSLVGVHPCQTSEAGRSGWDAFCSREECLEGLFGANCEGTCHCNDVGDCRSKDGTCPLSGCAPGWIGTNCQQECPLRTFGPNCAFACHCEDPGDCVKGNGSCPNSGCASGWMGENCQQECPDDRFGPGCTETLKNCHCQDASDCEREDGTCPNSGCAPGWTGDSCQQEYNNKGAGISVGTAAGVGVARLVIIVVLLLLSLYLWRRLQVTTRHRETNVTNEKALTETEGYTHMTVADKKAKLEQDHDDYEDIRDKTYNNEAYSYAELEN